MQGDLEEIVFIKTLFNRGVASIGQFPKRNIVKFPIGNPSLGWQNYQDRGKGSASFLLCALRSLRWPICQPISTQLLQFPTSEFFVNSKLFCKAQTNAKF